jgi:Flp pilus assembly protein TadG
MRPEPNRPARRSAKGQAMAIFALVSVLLFVVAGLAVDAGASYLTSNKLERAAAAAALAGVAYLPGDYPDAQNAALVEAARDGFPNAGAANACAGSPTPSPCVVTSQPKDNELTVTISASVSTIFLRLVGFGSHTVVRSETAQYLPPISLGQPGAQQGADLAGLGVTGYFERQEGWGNPRSEGDPFTPTPFQNNNSCGPSGGDSCSAAGAPDYHAISPANQTENQDATLEYQGGSDYLIDLPPGASADVQVYNPAFAADTCGGGSTSAPYCYHENDGSFGGSGSVCTEYSAMAYTLFSVTTLSSRLQDAKVGQETFYPYNESNSPANYFYYQPGANGGSCPSQTTVSGTNPTYHQWVSVLTYLPTLATDPENYNARNGPSPPASSANRLNGYISNPAGATVDKFYRLEVDSQQWNGWPSCKATVGPCATPDSTVANGGNGFSNAHKGYAVRLVSPGTSACTSCGSVSAMDDMTVFTPVNGASSPQFAIPLFSIDPTAYAGETINVDLFDVGDVGGGAAYVGLREPDGVTWATANSMTDLGADLGGSSPPSGSANVSSLGNWPAGGASCGACYQTAGGGGGAIYQGQWVQLQIQIPASFTAPGGVACTTSGTSNCYWSLVYDVNSAATAADTFSVEVGFSGSPDHLLP